MSGTASKVPPALRHNLEHNHVLHERVVFLTVKTQPIPHVPLEDRVETEDFGDGLYRVKVYYGFMEEPNIPEALAHAAAGGLDLGSIGTIHVFPGPRDDHRHAASGHGALARKAVRVHVAQCDDGDRVFRHSSRSSRGAG